MSKLFTVLLEAFPDAMLELEAPRVESSGAVFAHFSFTGTKLYGLPTDVLLRLWVLQQKQNAAAAAASASTSATEGDNSNGNISSSNGGGGGNLSGSISLMGVMQATKTHNEAMRKRVRGMAGGRALSLEGHHGAAPLPPNAHAHAHAHSARSIAGAVAQTPPPHQPSVKLAGHIVLHFDAANRVNRWVFVWNCTSMMGQVRSDARPVLCCCSKGWSV